MDTLIEIFRNTDLGLLIAITILGWFFYCRLTSKFESRIDRLENRLDTRIDKLDEKLTDVDRRLCRIEGAFTAKECCVLKEDRQLKKAE